VLGSAIAAQPDTQFTLSDCDLTFIHFVQINCYLSYNGSTASFEYAHITLVTTVAMHLDPSEQGGKGRLTLLFPDGQCLLVWVLPLFLGDDFLSRPCQNIFEEER